MSFNNSLRLTQSTVMGVGREASEDSRASSLGPSDSASQRSRLDYFALEKAVADLLTRVEAPSVRPRYLPSTVLWYFEDCAHDMTCGEIVTPANPNRPKMSRAIRRDDGSVVSYKEYTDIRKTADIVVLQFLEHVNGPDAPMHPGRVRTLTATVAKSLFHAQFRQAILNLEAEEPLLRLCARHWKAETLISQALARRNEQAGSRGNHEQSVVSSFDPPPPPDPVSTAPLSTAPLLTPSFPTPSLPNVPSSQVSGLASSNAAKRAFELSPGPKSPSASHTQKRVKDINAPLRQKTSGCSAPPPREYSIFITFALLTSA